MEKASTAPGLDEFRLDSAGDLAALREQLLAERDPDRLQVIVCQGTGCLANGSAEVAQALMGAAKTSGVRAAVSPGIKTTGCQGFCSRGPLVVVRPAGFFYQRVRPRDAEEIIETTLVEGRPVERLLYTDIVTGEPIPHESEISFYKRQQRLVLRNLSRIDPMDITDYIATGGYRALAKALTSMAPDEVISEVIASGLRGRGGGGFPAGVKWQTCRKAKGQPKYVLCNADEGDPGAYMDRSICEGDPHSILEGMLIGAYAIGAGQGYTYVRAEYPLAVETLRTAIASARELGLLGRNILGTGFDFDIKINLGGGAFVCGESTALMASIEGKPGEPKAKYVHTVEMGLWDRPSNLNNVETWANVPLIIDRGADWFNSIGVEGSTGTKVFSLVGQVNNVGLVEVPMGITVKEMVEQIGGGVPGKKAFKAIQTGGPSGGCIPKKDWKLPIDFDSLRQAGSMMGSGGMIVMDETTCMVDVAKYFMEFLVDESCGKCIPCRLGLKRMLEMLDDFSRGRGSLEDMDDLESLSRAVQYGSLCALGGTAPNPVLSTIRYFRDEYEAHILEKRCPAGVCKELITYAIDPELCNGCTLCARECPQGAITGKKKEPHELDAALCIKCGACRESCKFGAVQVS